MRRIVITLAAFSLLLSLLAGCGASGNTATNNSAPTKSASGAINGAPKHLFYIIFENIRADQIYGNTADAPYFNELVSKYASSTGFYGVTHPSLPNYLSLLSGNFQGIWDDCKAGPTITCPPAEFNSTSNALGKNLTQDEIKQASTTPNWFNGQNLVDQLEAHNYSWKAYMESAPSVGFTGEYYPVDTVNGKAVPHKLYAEKHNPFMYFTSIRNNPARMNKIVPFTQFDSDLQSGQIPNYVWITPNECNDMHSLAPSDAKALNIPTCAAPKSGIYHGPIQLGDKFLRDTVAKIEASPAWKDNSAIVATFDENDFSSHEGCCHGPTGINGVALGGGLTPFVVIKSQGAHHYVDSTPANHYSFLATLEKMWGLPCLQHACDIKDNELMTKLFV